MKKKLFSILSVILCLSFLTACVKREQSSTVTEEMGVQSGVDELIFAPLYQYVHHNVKLMGTIVSPPVLYDVTGDGYADLCASVTTGSGIISTLVVVYDVQNQKGYMLNDRMKFNYHILGIEDGQLMVNRRVWAESENGVIGTIRLEDDAIVFHTE